MNKLHLHDYALAAGAMSMALVGLRAYRQLATIANRSDRLKLFQYVGLINGLILLVTIVIFIVMR